MSDNLKKIREHLQKWGNSRQKQAARTENREVGQQEADAGMETATSGKDKGRNPYLPFYLLFILGLGGTGYMLSPYGHVQNIYVEGSKEVPEQAIVDSSSITNAQTVAGILWDEERIEKDIRSVYPKIKTAEVHRRGWNDITIAVEEYETVAYLENGKGYQSVLETGERLPEEMKMPLGNKPLLKGFTKAKDRVIREVAKQLQQLDGSVLNSISEINWSDPESEPPLVTIYMNDGNQVEAFLEQFGEKLSYYPAMVSQLEGEKGVINMEVGAFFTPFDTDEEEQLDEAAPGGSSSAGALEVPEVGEAETEEEAGN